MDLKEIRQLLKMVEGSDIHEIEIEEDGNKLKITKAASPTNGEVHVIQPPAPAVAAPVVQPAAAPVASAEPPTAPAAAESRV